MTQSINGTINRFLYQDLASGYVVFVLDLASQPHDIKTAITVKGKLPPLQPGQEVELTGSWVMDLKYGRQFEALTCLGTLPSSVTGLKRFLGSGLIKGIGKVYAEKIVNHFGTQVLTIIDKQPERLKEVGGIGAKRIETIASGWKQHKEIAEVMVFLQDKGITPSLAARIYKQYKHNTIPYIMQNPYRMAEDVWGVGFKTADEIAQKMGFGLSSPQRITAGVLFALLTAMQQGHLYVEIAELKKSVYVLLALSEDAVTAQILKTALHTLHEKGSIKLVTQPQGNFLSQTHCYVAEHTVAQKIRALIRYSSPRKIDTTALYKALSAEQQDIMLNEQQMHGILTALNQKVTIITGGPGTGKTTLIKKLLQILDQEQVTYKLAAPTGRAAKRITEGTGCSAATIHRLLEFDPISLGFKHNEKNALVLDFLIIDEASMIDIFLAHALLKAVPLSAHVLFIGDIDQLPSVGPGNVLNDCIASGVVPVVRLTEIFRQAQDSLIVTNAHRVNKGLFPLPYVPGSRHDFLFIKEQDPTTLPTHLKRILFSELAKHRISPADAIVLSPMNRGSAGTHLLNQHLQQLLNPHTQQGLMFNGHCLKLGDRVLQLRNNYDKFVFNGDMGIIQEIDEAEKRVVITFGSRLLEYDQSELSEITLAYAVTVHKSQGSEYPAVIIPLFTQHFTLLQRNLVYTALTRARSLCIIVGDPKALAMALKNDKSIQRTTFLQSFLKEGEA